MLFEDAVAHICRINRILESPRGNALLVGVGGSGKQSLSRLAAYISALDVFQITLKKGYGIPDLKVRVQTQRTQPRPYWMGLIIAKPWQGSVWSYLAKRLGTLSQITAG